MSTGRALVTGSAGFVGRHMTMELIRRGYDVTGVDIAPGRFGWQADMLAWLHHDRSRYELVVHAAAVAPHRAAIDKAPSTAVTNRLLDVSLFEWAVRTGQEHVLYFSSCAVLDATDLDEYALTKVQGENLARLARKTGLRVTVVRPFSGYGEDQSDNHPFRAFVERAKSRQDPFVLWGDGQQTRDWIHIDDVVHESLLAVECQMESPVSLCTGIGTSMRTLAGLICAEAGYEPEFKTLPGHHPGVARRVGTPAFIRKKIDLVEGIRRAFRG